MGYRVSKKGGTREALDAVENAVKARVGNLCSDIIPKIALKMDNGSQYTADLFHNEVKWLGFTPAYTFVGNPQGNSIAERVIGTIKRECIWGSTGLRILKRQRG